MKVQLISDYNLHPLVCSKIYLQATGRNLPSDFLIIAEDTGQIKTGLKPVRNYAEGTKLIEYIRSIKMLKGDGHENDIA